MKYRLLLTTFSMLSFALSVNAASIYKCTNQDNKVIFTDKPCPVGSDAKIIYTETAKDLKRKELVQKTATLRKFIETNQIDAAKEYAEKHQILDIYQSELNVYLQEKAEVEQQKAETEKQQKSLVEQQNLAIQRQQLELQKQQVEIDKAKLEEQKKLLNPPSYYPLYPLNPPFPRQPCKWPHYSYGCKPPHLPPPGGLIPPPVSPILPPMNPPISPILRPMNPPSNGGLNPP